MPTLPIIHRIAGDDTRGQSKITPDLATGKGFEDFTLTPTIRIKRERVPALLIIYRIAGNRR